MNRHPVNKASKSSVGQNLLDEFKETDMVIEEKQNECDDLSESMDVGCNPPAKNKVYKEKHFKKETWFNSN